MNHSYTWQEEWISENIKEKRKASPRIWLTLFLLSSKASKTKEHLLYAPINGKTKTKKKKISQNQPRNHLWEGNRGSRCHGHVGKHWLLVMFRFLGCMLGLWLFIMLCFTTSFILQSSVCITYVVLMYYKNNKGEWNNKPKSQVLTL